MTRRHVLSWVFAAALSFSPLRAHSDRGFSPAAPLWISLGAADIEIADVTGSPRKDVVVLDPTSQARVLIHDLDLAATSIVQLSISPRSLAIGDVDADGVQEMVVNGN